MYREVTSRRRKRKKRTQHMWMVPVILICVVLSITFLSGGGREAPAPQRRDGSEFVRVDVKPQPDQMPAPGEPESPVDPEDAWNLILVNPWNPLPEDYSVTLTQLKNGHAVDERCYPELQAMMDACRAAGLSPVICSSYRTQEKQETLYNNQVNKLIARGYSTGEAKTEAAKAVAVPGTSEHQLGLAVDIVDLNNQNLDSSQEDTAVQKWLMEHCWEYGFILRYPNGKSEITGIIYEPWHYRYVGKDAAKEITDAGICLEEYLAQS